MLIGEVAQLSGVSARMLRHYESRGLLDTTTRRSSGYREYSDDDLRRIFHIEALRTLGMTLEQVKSALDEPDCSVGEVVKELLSDTRARLRRDSELLERLQAVKSTGAEDIQSVLKVVALLSALRSGDPARRQLSALSLAGLDSIPLQQLVSSALAEPDPNTFGALSWAVLQVGEGALVEVAKGLRSRDIKVRRRALRILSRSLGSTTYLLDALEDSDSEVRYLAALALGKRGEDLAMPVLLQMILDGDRDVEAADVVALHPQWEPAVLGIISTELKNRHTSDPARARLTQALAELPGADELLKALVTDENRHVRVTATAIVDSTMAQRIHSRGFTPDQGQSSH